MAYTINDKYLIAEIKGNYKAYIGIKTENDLTNPYTGIMQSVYESTYTIAQEEAKKLNIPINKEDFKITFDKLEYPLDDEITTQLTNIIGEKDEIPYSKAKELDKLWSDLLRKSINCLRYFDIREPFMFDSSKKAVAYGIDQLEDYHNKYTKFESLLYGASEYYRDHIFHSVRTWLVGIFCLLHGDDESRFIDNIQIDGVAEKEPFAYKINFFEKLSMWTIAALCHDLGYPLEKSQQILDRTKNMMKEFVSNPTVFSNFAFNGIQDNINEYIVKFMSTKMKSVKTNNSTEQDETLYNGRIQPKYYLKYTKSLEKSKHGIISAVIIYKMLLYFLESDFNLNDDYIYTTEDARQFYIRREVLRSISSHTCTDIYNIKNTTFSSLLYLCDEMQEWGRKSWNDLYTNVNPDAVTLSIEKFDSESIEYNEEIKMENIKEDELIVDNIARLYTRQFETYQLIFRDGQYTNSRAFNLKKEIKIIAGKDGAKDNNFEIIYSLQAKEANEFVIDISNSQIKKDALTKLLCQKLKIKKLPDVIKINPKPSKKK